MRVHAGYPRVQVGYSDTARDWGQLVDSCVGRVGRYDRAAAPHMQVDTRSRAFNGRHSGAQLALAACTGGSDDATPTSGLGEHTRSIFRDHGNTARLN